jgi:hypothetical protein
MLKFSQWIDSCCINKSSSAELSEAINSMFEFYRSSQLFYAYLSDVPSSGDDPDLEHSKFRASAWFTRGWTLQELLAPKYVEFYAQDWSEIGTKASLGSLIKSITGIMHLSSFQNASVAEKMSWASRRETTRPEDQAYCLMGLFDVNMPTIYGEGEKAFIRLQLEILSQTNDESIFAWNSFYSTGGLLASSPTFFRDAGNVITASFDPERPPHIMTNKGLRSEFILTPYLLEDGREAFLAPLNCKERSEAASQFITLVLTMAGHAYSREGSLHVPSRESMRLDYEAKRTLTYSVQSMARPTYQKLFQRLPNKILVDTTPLLPWGIKPIFPDSSWSWKCVEDNILSLDKGQMDEYKSAALWLQDEDSTTFALVIGSGGQGHDGLSLGLISSQVRQDVLSKDPSLFFWYLNEHERTPLSSDRVSEVLSYGNLIKAGIKMGNFNSKPAWRVTFTVGCLSRLRNMNLEKRRVDRNWREKPGVIFTKRYGARRVCRIIKSSSDLARISAKSRRYRHRKK